MHLGVCGFILSHPPTHLKRLKQISLSNSMKSIISRICLSSFIFSSWFYFFVMTLVFLWIFLSLTFCDCGWEFCRHLIFNCCSSFIFCLFHQYAHIYDFHVLRIISQFSHVQTKDEHSSFMAAWSVTPMPAFLQALALVASPRLGSWQKLPRSGMLPYLLVPHTL